jgi:hypothetical protein
MRVLDPDQALGQVGDYPFGTLATLPEADRL